MPEILSHIERDHIISAIQKIDEQCFPAYILIQYV